MCLNINIMNIFKNNINSFGSLNNIEMNEDLYAGSNIELKWDALDGKLCLKYYSGNAYAEQERVDKLNIKFEYLLNTSVIFSIPISNVVKLDWHGNVFTRTYIPAEYCSERLLRCHIFIAFETIFGQCLENWGKTIEVVL